MPPHTSLGFNMNRFTVAALHFSKIVIGLGIEMPKSLRSLMFSVNVRYKNWHAVLFFTTQIVGLVNVNMFAVRKSPISTIWILRSQYSDAFYKQVRMLAIASLGLNYCTLQDEVTDYP